MKSLIIAFIILFGIAATAVYYPIQTDATLTGDGTVENPLAVASSFSSAKVAVTDTATMLAHFVERGDTSTMLGKYILRSGRSGGQTIVGGSGTTDDLILQSTRGVGATGALIQFKGGNNGATTFGQFLNDGTFGLGSTSPTFDLDIQKTGVANTFVGIRMNDLSYTLPMLVGSLRDGTNAYSLPGIWLGTSSPSYTNYAFLNDGADNIFNTPSGSSMRFRVNNSTKVSLSTSLLTSTVPIVIPTGTPASSGASGTAGQISWDGTYLYVCTATNTWKRIALTTF